MPLYIEVSSHKVSFRWAEKGGSQGEVQYPTGHLSDEDSHAPTNAIPNLNSY